MAAAGLGLVSPVLAEGCKVPPDLIKLQAPLPTLAQAIVAKQPIRIVALGSSSTWGTGASSRERTYPARLDKELRAVWPANDVRVINAGVDDPSATLRMGCFATMACASVGKGA